MSRFDSDVDYFEWLVGYVRANASCSDCGEPFVKERADVGSLCDGCCDARDDHTSALEQRFGDADPDLPEAA